MPALFYLMMAVSGLIFVGAIVGTIWYLRKQFPGREERRFMTTTIAMSLIMSVVMVPAFFYLSGTTRYIVLGIMFIVFTVVVGFISIRMTRKLSKPAVVSFGDPSHNLDYIEFHVDKTSTVEL